MDPAYIPFIAAFGGALVGSLTAVLIIMVQTRAETRRQRFRLASEMAMEEYRSQIDVLKSRGSGAFLPMSAFLHHHIEVAKAIEEGDLTPDRLRRISADNHGVVDAAIEIDEAWRKKARLNN